VSRAHAKGLNAVLHGDLARYPAALRGGQGGNKTANANSPAWMDLPGSCSLAATAADRADLYQVAAVRFLIFTGARLSEILTCRGND
jgi:hypothetical protein